MKILLVLQVFYCVMLSFIFIDDAFSSCFFGLYGAVLVAMVINYWGRI